LNDRRGAILNHDDLQSVVQGGRVNSGIARSTLRGGAAGCGGREREKQ
jgi:hypothetical protein